MFLFNAAPASMPIDDTASFLPSGLAATRNLLTTEHNPDTGLFLVPSIVPIVALEEVPVSDETNGPSQALPVAASSARQPTGKRNDHQMAAIFALSTGDYAIQPLYPGLATFALEQMFGPLQQAGVSPTESIRQRLNWAYRCYRITPIVGNEQLPILHDGTNDGRYFQEFLYLFNMLVAFEWQPSQYDLAVIQRAAQRAADFLYDVTDGWMSFGQVVIGGPELLNCADIQVMASNRLHPRAWVGGLHEYKKYVPIRLGRGLWQKNNRVSIPWDEPEGYRTLIHEWAHYALELIDGYLETHDVYLSRPISSANDPKEDIETSTRMILPSISLAVESIMSRLEGTSELVPKRDSASVDGKYREWKTIIDGYKDYGPRYPRIKEQPRPIEGPLPLRELPHVVRFLPQDVAISRVEHMAEVSLFDIPRAMEPEHCWVYVLKYGKNGNLERIIAQGTLDDRLRSGFRLLDANAGDHIVLIGDTSSYEPVILHGTIKSTELTERLRALSQKPSDLSDYIGRKEAIIVWEPQARTPEHFPLIDVLPEALPSYDKRTARIRVHVVSTIGDKLDLDRSPEVSIFPLDQATDEPRTAVSAIKVRVDEPTQQYISLDGHVFIQWKDSDRLVIATFSQGGGPPTGSPVNGGAPITAGSSDGNVMIFFDDRAESIYKNIDTTKIRIITTRQPGVAADLAESILPGAAPRGYAFSLASNEPLPLEYKPTLAIAYDNRIDLADGEPLIHRLDDTGMWQPITSYRPRGAWYVAAPLNEETAPRLIKPGLPKTEARVERYRLFLVPRHTPDNQHNMS